MKAEIAVVVDESGSMGPLVVETISGMNRFIRDQKSEPGEAVLSIYKFSTNFDKIYDNVDIKSAREIDHKDYLPAGMTALYDAIGESMNRIGERIQTTKPDKVIMCIITDGQENASKEYTSDKIKVMIEHAKASGWEFVFLGADPTSVAMAVNIGIPQNMTSIVETTSKGHLASYSTFSQASRALRSGVTAQSLNMRAEYKKMMEEIKA